MASLSTCHLGLWLGWQIFLNLVKSMLIHKEAYLSVAVGFNGAKSDRFHNKIRLCSVNCTYSSQRKSVLMNHIFKLYFDHYLFNLNVSGTNTMFKLYADRT